MKIVLIAGAFVGALVISLILVEILKLIYPRDPEAPEDREA